MARQAAASYHHRHVASYSYVDEMVFSVSLGLLVYFAFCATAAAAAAAAIDVIDV